MTFENSIDVKGSDELILVHFTYRQIDVPDRYHFLYIYHESKRYILDLQYRDISLRQLSINSCEGLTIKRFRMSVS